MKRIMLAIAIAIALSVVASFVLFSGASSGTGSGASYKIEFDNAFGLVTGADFKVAGVPAGTITSIKLDQKTLHAVVTIEATQRGFTSFRADAFCQSRPQSLIGEYFIDCDPGHTGKALRPGSVIPVTRTQSTIPADLVQNILRMPYRERLSLIINELGAAVAGRTEDLQSALRRAVPSLTQADNLLHVLAENRTTLRRLVVHSNTVITALADNRTQVRRFVQEANKTATASGAQAQNLHATFQQLPGFLEQLRPALAELGASARANQPAVTRLGAASGALNRLFTDVPAFARSGLPAIRSLGQASVTGKSAVLAAGPTILDLNRFSRLTPELAKNLSIVLPDLDKRSRAVERDPRSPGGKGYTGLEALLQYVFNQTLAVNVFGPYGHVLTSDAFLDPQCSFYASSTSVALSLGKYGPKYRHCYSWLGPSQPGVNQPDPSNPTACVPDPGGAPPGKQGPRTTVCKLSIASAERQIASAPVADKTKPTGSGYASTGAAPASVPGAASLAAAEGPAGAVGGSAGQQTLQLLRYLLAP